MTSANTECEILRLNFVGKLCSPSDQFQFHNLQLLFSYSFQVWRFNIALFVAEVEKNNRCCKNSLFFVFDENN